MGVCNCSVFCCTLLDVHSSIAIILMGKRELVALLNLSSWCLVMVGRLFLAVPWGCLRFVIVVFPDHTHLLFFMASYLSNRTQWVKIGRVVSSWAKIIKGAPWGSILGPLIFNTFINDIFYFINQSKIYSYADDNTVS